MLGNFPEIHRLLVVRNHHLGKHHIRCRELRVFPNHVIGVVLRGIGGAAVERDNEK